MLKTVMSRSAIIAFACSLSLSVHAMADGTKRAIHIPSGDLAVALQLLAKQSGTDLVYRPDQVEGFKTGGVDGELSTEQAVTRLLKGTPLTVSTDSTGAMLIALPTSAPPSEAPQASTNESVRSKSFWSRLRIAQADPAPTSQVGAQNPSPSKGEGQGEDERPAQSQKRVEVEEVVVTGTHLRGTTSTTSPVQVFTRDDIDRMGLGSVQEFIQRLPQNFNGGASDSTLSSIAGGGNAANAVGGTGVNLRGLGNDATLVLVDGRRVAPGNTSGNFVDISLIPLSAIERVEVVTDGASAIYGSDAVGGVVNFILRHDLEGAETRLRYGSDYKGATHEIDAGQSLGHQWDSGHALISYEFVDRTPLTAEDRPYTRNAIEPFTLLPLQVRHGAFFTLDQNVTPGVVAFLDANYSHRSTNASISSPFFTSTNPAQIDAYGGTLGTRIELPAEMAGEVSGTYETSHTRAQTLTSGLLSDDQNVHSTVWSLDAKVDGTLGSMPAGPIRFAVGAQYRQERFEDADPFVLSTFAPSRSVGAEYLEVRFPLLGRAHDDAQWGDRLTLSLADRNEHYSDFGSTNNPLLGLIWKPSPGAVLRANVGKSFHAPLLSDLNPIPSQVIPYPEADPVSGGVTNALLLFGGNPDLQPEKATTWSLSAGFQPTVLPGFKLNLAYYDIRFKDRIANAQLQGVDLTNALALENILGPRIVQRSPSPSLVQALVATPGYADLFGTGIDPASIGALVDSRSQNLSRQTTRGVDFDVGYSAPTTVGLLETGVSGTRVLKFDTRFTAGSPAVAILNTVYNPTDLKLRARALLTRDAFTTALFVNFVDSSHDNRSGTSLPIASWTTVDATVGYQWSGEHALFSQTALTFAVLNITNARPPFVAPQYPGAYNGATFDGANANPLGRYMSLQLSTHY